MGTIFMNCENSKISEPHRLLLNLSDKIDPKRSDKYVCFIKCYHVLHMKIYKKVVKISGPT